MPLPQRSYKTVLPLSCSKSKWTESCSRSEGLRRINRPWIETPSSMIWSRKMWKLTGTFKCYRKKSKSFKDSSVKNYSSQTTSKTSTSWKSSNTSETSHKCPTKTPDHPPSTKPTIFSPLSSNPTSTKRAQYASTTPQPTRPTSKPPWNHITYRPTSTPVTTQTPWPSHYQDRHTTVSTWFTERCRMSWSGWNLVIKIIRYLMGECHRTRRNICLKGQHTRRILSVRKTVIRWISRSWMRTRTSSGTFR